MIDHRAARCLPGNARLASLARLGVAALALLGAGCSVNGAYQAFTYRNRTDNPHPEKIYTYSYDRALASRGQPYFKDAYKEGPPKTVRNRIMYELMGIVDDFYYRYTVELRQDITSKGIVADAVGISTSLAATAAGGEGLKTLLAAISTAGQGLNKSIDANILLGNTVQAIRLQMDAARADLATEIIAKLREQDVADYPLEAGLRDIIRYYDAGTVTSGVASLSKISGTNKADAEADQKARALKKPTLSERQE